MTIDRSDRRETSLCFRRTRLSCYVCWSMIGGCFFLITLFIVFSINPFFAVHSSSKSKLIGHFSKKLTLVFFLCRTLILQMMTSTSRRLRTTFSNHRTESSNSSSIFQKKWVDRPMTRLQRRSISSDQRGAQSASSDDQYFHVAHRQRSVLARKSSDRYLFPSGLSSILLGQSTMSRKFPGLSERHDDAVFQENRSSLLELDGIRSLHFDR